MKYFNEREEAINKRIKEGRETKDDILMSEIITRIREIISTQKISGAMVGLFNASLVARIEGIKESVEIEHKGDKQEITLKLGENNVNLTKRLK